MESLSDTIWDVVLSGTGLSQSLLALALSRSGKKVLHIDKNDYYGGAEAALSLQEVEAWAESVDKDAGPSPFRHAKIRHKVEDDATSADKGPSKLGYSRAYSLSLAPQLVYTRSNLLPTLVSSKIYRQLEFLAVGSWWLYEKERGTLRRIPGGREDVFADKSIDLRSTRSLMKFLKLAADPEAHTSILEEWGSTPFPNFLESHFGIHRGLQAPLLALTSSPNTPDLTATSYALPRIHRHLTSIGMFGPGFGAVIPKWGGLAEIAQVACRAQAVGGGVYVLKKGFETNEHPEQQVFARNGTMFDKESGLSTVHLEGGENIRTRWIAGSVWDLPSRPQRQKRGHVTHPKYIARSITIVSGSLVQLFPSPAEGAPPPAGAVIVYPTNSLELGSEDQTPGILKTEPPPVYLTIHSSDTGECPAGQCVIYAHTHHPERSGAHNLLQTAAERLLTRIDEEAPATILWYMHYDQRYSPPTTTDDHDVTDHVLQLPGLEPGLVLEDDVLKHVRAAYLTIAGSEGADFMMFEDREGAAEDDNETEL